VEELEYSSWDVLERSVRSYMHVQWQYAISRFAEQNFFFLSLDSASGNFLRERSVQVALAKNKQDTRAELELLSKAQEVFPDA